MKLIFILVQIVKFLVIGYSCLKKKGKDNNRKYRPTKPYLLCGPFYGYKSGQSAEKKAGNKQGGGCLKAYPETVPQCKPNIRRRRTGHNFPGKTEYECRPVNRKHEQEKEEKKQILRKILKKKIITCLLHNLFA